MIVKVLSATVTVALSLRIRQQLTTDLEHSTWAEKYPEAFKNLELYNTDMQNTIEQVLGELKVTV